MNNLINPYILGGLIPYSTLLSTLVGLRSTATRTILSNGFADAFFDNTGVDVGTAPSTNYANSLGTGNRTASITVTDNNWSGTPDSDLVDGNTGVGTIAPQFAADNRADWIKFDFGVGVKKYITKVKVYKTTSAGEGFLRWEGSNDDTNWFTVSSTQIQNAATFEFTLLPLDPAGYRYYRMIGTGGVPSGNNHREFEFEINNGDNTAFSTNVIYDTVNDIFTCYPVTAYSNADGVGDRTSRITVSKTGFTWDSGTDAGLVDGVVTSTQDEPSGTAATNATIRFDFGASNPKYISAMRYTRGASGTSNNAQWKVRCSNDASTWLDISATLTMNGTGTFEVQLGYPNQHSPKGYRYYELIGVSGTFDNGFQNEWEFKTAVIASTEATTSYLNSGGKGDRTGQITVSSTIAWDSGTLANLVDGLNNNNMDYPASSSAGQYIRFDFGAGNKKYIDEIKVHTVHGGTGSNFGTWKIQGSNDATAWDDLSSSFTFAGDTATTTYACTPVDSNGYRYYQFVAVSPAFANDFVNEFEFKIRATAAATAANMDLRSKIYTAASAPGTANLVILYKAVEAAAGVTLNTDFLGRISRDGGTTFTTVSLTDAGASGIAGYNYLTGQVDISAQPSDVNMKVRAVTANNKMVEVAGWAASWT